MEPENQDAPEVLETQETEETTETVEEEKVELTKAEADELRAKAAKADDLEEKNKQLFERVKKEKGTAKSLDVAPKDYLALTQAGITADDFDEVMEFATYKKISISEALKNPTLKTILSTAQAERATANATQTSSARGTKKPSGEDLLAKAERGEALEGTAEEMSSMFQARLARKTAHHRK